MTTISEEALTKIALLGTVRLTSQDQQTAPASLECLAQVIASFPQSIQKDAQALIENSPNVEAAFLKLVALYINFQRSLVCINAPVILESFELKRGRLAKAKIKTKPKAKTKAKTKTNTNTKSNSNPKVTTKNTVKNNVIEEQIGTLKTQEKLQLSQQVLYFFSFNKQAQVLLLTNRNTSLSPYANKTDIERSDGYNNGNNDCTCINQRQVLPLEYVFTFFQLAHSKPGFLLFCHKLEQALKTYQMRAELAYYMLKRAFNVNDEVQDACSNITKKPYLVQEDTSFDVFDLYVQRKVCQLCDEYITLLLAIPPCVFKEVKSILTFIEIEEESIKLIKELAQDYYALHSCDRKEQQEDLQNEDSQANETHEVNPKNTKEELSDAVLNYCYASERYQLFIQNLFERYCKFNWKKQKDFLTYCRQIGYFTKESVLLRLASDIVQRFNNTYHLDFIKDFLFGLNSTDLACLDALWKMRSQNAILDTVDAYYDQHQREILVEVVKKLKNSSLRQRMMEILQQHLSYEQESKQWHYKYLPYTDELKIACIEEPRIPMYESYHGFLLVQVALFADLSFFQKMLHIDDAWECFVFLLQNPPFHHSCRYSPELSIALNALYQSLYFAKQSNQNIDEQGQVNLSFVERYFKERRKLNEVFPNHYHSGAITALECKLLALLPIERLEKLSHHLFQCDYFQFAPNFFTRASTAKDYLKFLLDNIVCSTKEDYFGLHQYVALCFGLSQDESIPKDVFYAQIKDYKEKEAELQKQEAKVKQELKHKIQDEKLKTKLSVIELEQYQTEKTLNLFQQMEYWLLQGQKLKNLPC